MEIGIVRPVLIEEEMKGAYLDYAMSVITARALPDVRDGLKPVQRRILYAMDELGLRHTAAYKKSARIVGEVMGKYHPHGDAPVYESMVRMAQDFSMRYPLVDGQGNFGSVDGDPAAAMRYTEARLAAIAEEMLADIDKNTVDFAGNFDDTLKEPKVLPSKLPNLLVNGSAGIAVGMATNIPPHNLGEVIDALTYIISRFGAALDAGVPFALVWGRAFNAPADLAVTTQALNALDPALKQRVQAAAAKLARRPDGEQRVQALFDVVDDMIDVPPDKLMDMVKGPDFPTAGIILGGEGIKNAYATGHGRVTIRARAHTEDMRGGRTQIVVTELPFQVNKAALLEKIAELVRERRVEGISELRDESDRQGMRVVIELRREAQPRHVLNHLYKYTAMQTTFSVNMLALVDGQPRVLTLKMVLLHYLNHRREVITRRTEFDLERARHRAHILQGLKIALDHLDEVIATIRRSKDAETARTALMKNFKLSELQAQAILDMQLRRLAALERQKILDEYAETLKLIARLEDLLAHPVKILYLIRDELLELKTRYGDERRTQIRAEEAVDFSEEDLIPDQEVVVSMSAKGYVRRVLADNFRLQRRGSKGIVGTLSREDDPPLQFVVTSTRDSLLLFSNRGRAYQMRVNDVPDVTRQARGLPLGNFVSLDEQERVVAALPLGKLEGRHVVLATRRGEVKRVAASEYASARGAGIIGVAVPENDDLVGAVATSGRQEIVLVTAEGQAIRFAESELRPSGRNSGGVRGMRLGDKDRVVAIDVARTGAQLVAATRRGFAKRTPLAEYSTQGRGGGGIRAATVSLKNGELVAGLVAGEGDDLVLVTAAGTVLRSTVSALPAMGRTTQGSAIISLDRDDKVLAAAVVPARERSPADGKASGAKGEPQEPSNGAEQSAGPDGGSAVPAGVASAKRGGTQAGAKAGRIDRSARPAKSEGTASARQGAQAARGGVAVAEALQGTDRSVGGSPDTGDEGGAVVAGSKAVKGAAKRVGGTIGRAKTAQSARPARDAKPSAAVPSARKSTAAGGSTASKAGATINASPARKNPAATKQGAPVAKKAATTEPAVPPAKGQRAAKGKAEADGGAPGATVTEQNWRPIPPATSSRKAAPEANPPADFGARAVPQATKAETANGAQPAGKRAATVQPGGANAQASGKPAAGKKAAKKDKQATLFGSIAATLAGSVKAAPTGKKAKAPQGKVSKGQSTSAAGEQAASKKRKTPSGPEQTGLPLQ